LRPGSIPLVARDLSSPPPETSDMTSDQRLQQLLNAETMAHPEWKKQKLEFSNTFTVLVGSEKKNYVLHKCFVVKTSGFFATATNGNWEQSKDQISLPDYDSPTFEQYLQWLYTGSIVTADSIDGCSQLDPSESLKRASAIYEQLLKLYFLAQYLLDLACKNAVMDKMIDVQIKTRVWPGAVSTIDKIWSTTPDKCPMQRLVVRYWSLFQKADQARGDFEKLPSSFSSSIIQESLAKRDGAKTWPPSLKFRCDYHEHDEMAPTTSDCGDDVPKV